MRPAVAVLAVLGSILLAGCGGGSSHDSAPSEPPGKAMIRLVQHELNGQLGSSYAMLIDEQRREVNRDLYVHCPPGVPRNDVRVLVLRVRNQRFNVPGLGQTDTKAVTYEMSIPDAEGHRMKVSDTGHLIAENGQWRWTLSQRSLSALLAGACP